MLVSMLKVGAMLDFFPIQNRKNAMLTHTVFREGESDSVACRGGGDTPIEGRSPSDMRRSGSSASMTSQGRGR